MKIAISSGHGKYIRGASGIPPSWGLDEVDEARKVVDETARVLTAMGVDVKTFHDNTSHDQNTNLNTIVNWHNKQTRDLDISVHFNAYTQTEKAMGTECLFVTQEALAREVANAIADAGHFLDRGPKKRTDLFFLNNTSEPAILVETCFVDSHTDADLYREHFSAICTSLAASVSGEAVPPDIPDIPDIPDVPDRPPPEPEAGHPTIGKGDTGVAVDNLQRSIGCLVDDGDFGSITETWVKGFQAAVDLDVDGIVGPNTWGEVDDLDGRMAETDTGLSDSQITEIVRLANACPAMNYSWRNRGIAPPGYIPGMALCFAYALTPTDATDVMSKAASGNSDLDALSWYSGEFSRLGMKNNRNGTATLRHLFVLLTGLGMRESSGRYCEGRDLSASNVEADTAEAGLFQTSWNIRSANTAIPPLLYYHWDHPQGFRDVFAEKVTASKDNLSCYGSGDGALYQWLSRFSPLFHTLVTGVGLRWRRQHWGPINRKEAELLPSIDELLIDVQELVEAVA